VAPGGPGTPAAPSEAAPAPATGEAERIDAILTQLERRGDDIKDIRCQVQFRELDKLSGSDRLKEGEILFAVVQPNPKFLIRFDRTTIDGIVGKREWYLFDGQWLFEANERTQRVTKREIAEPDEKVDLFDIETAPFPLPFGQKKDKILRHFEVSLTEPKEGDPADTDHVVCIPKPGSRLERNYEKLEFFIRRELHLPVKVVMTKSKGYEVTTASFPDLSAASLNRDVAKDAFAEPQDWKKYEQVIERLEGAETPQP